jgi:hypothetical protein
LSLPVLSDWVLSTARGPWNTAIASAGTSVVTAKSRYSEVTQSNHLLGFITDCVT